MPTVGGFNLTPVKSTAVACPDAIALGGSGALGDRRFLFGRLEGSRPSGISKAPLLGIRAEWDRVSERLTLTLPDGKVVSGDSRARGDAIAVALHDRSVPARRIDPAFDGAIAAIDDTLRLLRVDEPEYAGGRHRVSLVSRASVVRVGETGGEPALDPRRFRMLVEVDGVEPFQEEAWSGARIRLGNAVVRLGDGIPRCVMTTLDPRTGRQDFPTLDALARTRRAGNALVLGVYGDVEVPGVVRVGDAIDVIDP